MAGPDTPPPSELKLVQADAHDDVAKMQAAVDPRNRVDPTDLTAADHKALLDGYRAFATGKKNDEMVLPAIYVLPDGYTVASGAKLFHTKRGSDVILIDKTKGQWSEQAFDKAVPTHQFVDDKVNKGDYMDARTTKSWNLTGTEQEFETARYDKIAGQMKKAGLASAPEYYLDLTDKDIIPYMQAAQTRDGKQYVVFNAAALSAWNRDQRAVMMAHELDHLARGDTQTKNIVDHHNRHILRATIEHRADIEAAGPLGTCDPKALKEAVQIMYDQNLIEAQQIDPKMTAAKFKVFYDQVPQTFESGHGKFDDRKAAMDDLIKHPANACPVPAKKGRTASHSTP